MRNRKQARVSRVLAIMLLGTLVNAANAQTAGALFTRGQRVATLRSGVGYAFDNTYLIVGGGLGFYPLDGLNVMLDFEYWGGASPTIYRITPQLNYIFQKVQTVKPYVGTYYRYSSYEGLDDVNSVGLRAGAGVVRGRTLVGLGVVYDVALDAETSQHEDHSTVYPEVFVSIGF